MMAGLAEVYDLRSEEEAKKYLDRIGIEYRFQCYHEKRPDGCHRLGDYLEAFKHDWLKARMIYKTNCDENKYGQSCFKYGNYNMVGRAGDKDLLAASDAYQKGCDFAYSPCCHNAALLHQAGLLGETKDFVKAADYLKRGCQGGNAPSCQQLSTYFITGKDGVPKDMRQAFEYAHIACEMGHMYACGNLSQMYKRGEGTGTNQELADKYRDKAKELFKSVSHLEKEIKFGE